MDTAIEVARARNEGAVDQKELASKAMRERTTDGGFPGGPYSNTPRLGRKPSSAVNESFVSGRTI